MNIGPFSPGRGLFVCRFFGGSSSSSNSNTENVTQPTATNSGSGAGANTVATTGAVTFNQESPQALNDLALQTQTLGNVALAALQTNSETAKSTEALVGQNTASQTQQLTPIIIIVALVGLAALYFKNRR